MGYFFLLYTDFELLSVMLIIHLGTDFCYLDDEEVSTLKFWDAVSY